MVSNPVLIIAAVSSLWNTKTVFLELRSRTPFLYLLLLVGKRVAPILRVVDPSFLAFEEIMYRALELASADDFISL